jgi:hypothetical protein
MSKLWQSAVDLAWSWWTCDRIRVSATEGRLLRIVPGDLLSLGSADVEVLHRRIQESPGGRSLVLACWSIDGDFELAITHGIRGEILSVVCTNANGIRDLQPDDIQIWSRTSACRPRVDGNSRPSG